MTATTATERVYNFSAGPAVLPLPVLEQIQEEMLCLPGAGASILEISHRSPEFDAVLTSAKTRLKRLLMIPDNYHILFLQGGSRLQFSMVPMNLLRGAGHPADYILTGAWGKKALAEARREGDSRVAWDGGDMNYVATPKNDELKIDASAAYVHYTSNETIQGVQFSSEPDAGGPPLVCDASSDFMCRQIAIERYGLLYACAQKNAGPAGVTVVILRDDLLQQAPESLPGYLKYREHAANDSCYNTPPTFGIYVVDLVAKWIEEEVGGLDAMHDRNRKKSKLLYDVIDASDGFYRGHAITSCRSLMNVTFRLGDPKLEERFFSEAKEHRLCSLKGHRSVGGVRASIYNAMPEEGVVALRDFMRDFAAKKG